MGSRLQQTRIAEQPKNVPASSAAEVIHDQLDLGGGRFWRYASLTETLALNGAFIAFTNSIPAGAIVRFGRITLKTAMALTTAVKLGVGTSGSPSAFGLSGTVMTQNAKATVAAADANARTTAATTPRVSAVDVNGAAAGSGIGTVVASILYEYVQDLPD